MPCPRCDIHSFERFGIVGTSALFYTAPAKSTDFRTSDHRLADFKLHLDAVKGAPWIWVIDCGNMGREHSAPFSFARGLATILATEHADCLKGIWVMQPNAWFSTILKGLKLLIRSPLFDKVRLLDGGPLHLHTFLKEEGVDLAARQWLTSH